MWSICLALPSSPLDNGQGEKWKIANAGLEITIAAVNLQHKN